jgi:AraC-like DNA-binding protein
MELALDLTAILSLLGGAQGILLASALLVLKQGNRAATRLLAAFMLVSAINIGGSLVMSTKYIFHYPHLTQLATPFHFLLGPIVFLYIRVAISRERRLGKKELLHLVPFVICAAYYLPLYLQSREGKLSYLAQAFQNYPSMEWRIKSLLLLCQALPYLILTFWIFTKHIRKTGGLPVQNRFNLLWLRTFLAMIFIIIGAGLYRLFFHLREETMLLIPLCFSVLVYVAGYMALKHPEALTGMDESTLLKKYEKSTLTTERAESYLKRLLQTMETEKPFLDGDLTLQKLAERLSIPVNHLSQIINEQQGQNFVDFVNAYRVKEAQRMLLDSSKKHYTVLAIAEEVGFNSKSAFNAAFKKHAHMTPTEFRRAAGSEV